ncbi:MAG: GLPGLI family protein [Saprospiraceae bacterium]
MKHTVLFFFFLLPFFLAAQNTQGTITYTETVQIKMDIQDDDPQMAEMRKSMPSSQSFSQALYFKDQVGLYRDPVGQPDPEDLEVKREQGGMDMQMVMKRPESQVYHDLAKKETLRSQEFFGRDFLIQGEAKPKSWKITGEQKTILNFVCQKAVLQDTSRSVEAWFAPQIPVALGPGEFTGLPGLILEVRIANGERTALATQIDWSPLPKDVLVKPKKGKSVTEAEFNRIRDEKMKEMGADNGGNGMRVIIRN